MKTPTKKTQNIVKTSLFGLINKESTPSGSIKVSLNIKVVIIYLVLLGSLAGIGKSVALYYFFKEVRGFEQVKFTDMILFPLNRSQLRESQGEYQIEKGIAAVEEGEFRQALILLRQGIGRAPENAKGRLYLSRIYAGWRPELSIQILTEGYEMGIEDPDSIRLLLDLLNAEKEDSKILDLTKELLTKVEDKQLKQFVEVKRIQAAIATGQLELADQIFQSENIKNSMDGLILGSQLLIKMGKYSEAIDVLDSVIRQFPDEDLDPVFNILFSVIRINEDWETGRDYALKYSLRKPLSWEPRIVLIEFLEQSGESSRRDQEIEAVLKNYKSDQNAMATLANVCARLGLNSPSNRLYRLALNSKYPMDLFSMFLIESYTNSDSPETATILIDQIVDENPKWLENVKQQFNIIRSIAYYKSGDSDLGNLYFTYFIEARNSTIPQMMSAAKSFEEMGLTDKALRLYEEAYTREPFNEGALSMLLNLQLKTGNADNLSERLEQLTKVRRPAYRQINVIADKLKSDLFIFTENRDELIEELKEIAREPAAAEILLWKKKNT